MSQKSNKSKYRRIVTLKEISRGPWKPGLSQENLEVLYVCEEHNFISSESNWMLNSFIWKPEQCFLSHSDVRFLFFCMLFTLQHISLAGVDRQETMLSLNQNTQILAVQKCSPTCFKQLKKSFLSLMFWDQNISYTSILTTHNMINTLHLMQYNGIL